MWLLVVTRGRDRRCWFHPSVREHSIMPLNNRGIGLFLADLLDGGSDEVVLPVADAFTLIEDWDNDPAYCSGEGWDVQVVLASTDEQAPPWALDVRAAQPLVDSDTWDLIATVAQNRRVDNFGAPYLAQLQAELGGGPRQRRTDALKVLSDTSASPERVREASELDSGGLPDDQWVAVTGVLAAFHPQCPKDVFLRCVTSPNMYVRAAASLSPHLDDETSRAMDAAGGIREYELEVREPSLTDDPDYRFWIAADGANVVVVHVDNDQLQYLASENPDLETLIESERCSEVQIPYDLYEDAGLKVEQTLLAGCETDTY